MIDEAHSRSARRGRISMCPRRYYKETALIAALKSGKVAAADSMLRRRPPLDPFARLEPAEVPVSLIIPPRAQ